MSLNGKRVFFRPIDGAFQYKWSPDKFSKKKSSRKVKLREKKVGCTATPGSQGYDNEVKYVYKLSSGEHLAYVACTYVK